MTYTFNKNDTKGWLAFMSAQPLDRGVIGHLYLHPDVEHDPQYRRMRYTHGPQHCVDLFRLANSTARPYFVIRAPNFLGWSHSVATCLEWYDRAVQGVLSAGGEILDADPWSRQTYRT